MKISELLLEAGEQPIYCFMYGMLTDPDLMDGAEFVGKAILKNFAFEFAFYANVVATPGESVTGVLWETTRKKIAELDRVEGYPSFYDRKSVPVYFNGQKYEAFVYSMTPESAEQMAGQQPRESYLERLRTGYTHAEIPFNQINTALQKNEMLKRRR